MADQINHSEEGKVFWKATKRVLVLVICLVVLVLLAWIFSEEVQPFLAILRDPQQATRLAKQLGPVAPLVLGLLIMLQVVIPMIPGQEIVLACGYLYGPWWGTLLTCAAVFLSGQIAFALARLAGKPLVSRLASPRALEYWEKFAARRGLVFYISVYILPFMPSDLLVYVAGLDRISFRRFTVANIFGRLPMTVTTTILGAYHLMPPLGYWAAPGLIILLALIGCYWSLGLSRFIKPGDLVRLVAKKSRTLFPQSYTDAHIPAPRDA